MHVKALLNSAALWLRTRWPRWPFFSWDLKSVSRDTKGIRREIQVNDDGELVYPSSNKSDKAGAAKGITSSYGDSGFQFSLVFQRKDDAYTKLP